MPEIKYKAAKYIRLSHADENDGESNGVSNQRNIIDSYIEKQPDIEAVCEMVDDGFSGILFDRPAFKEMMEAIENGEVNCVIVKDLSRLGREYIETGRYLRTIFPAYGVRFIALTDNIDTLKDSGDDLIISVKSVMNDAYCGDISKKTRAALNSKRENGDYVGACPVYGYKKADDNRNLLVVDPYPADIVRDIFRMRTDGMSAARIAENLNTIGVLSPLEYKKDRGLPTPKRCYGNSGESKWTATTIIRMLRDETYTGTLVQGKRGKLNYRMKDKTDRPESEWKRVEGTHEAIIPQSDFDIVQDIMRLDTRIGPKGDTVLGEEHVYPFSGLLICGSCGGRMTRKTTTVNGKSYHYYYCPTGKKSGCDGSPTVKEISLSECVLKSLKAHIASIVSIEEILEGGERQKALTLLAGRIDEQIAGNERQIRQISGYKAALYENMMNGAISAKDYKDMKAGYSSDEKHLADANAKLHREKEDVLAGKSEQLRWMGCFKRYEQLDVIDRRVVVSLIRSIKINNKNDVAITFNYQDEYAKANALLRREAV